MKFFKVNFLIFLFVFPVIAFPQLPSFDSQTPYPAPDYSLEQNWSALPFRVDAADEIPKGETWISDSLKNVDVFYIHPTVYGKGLHWNASVSDKRINKKVDTKPVRYQTTVFNESCRVYAPRYRQAIVEVFYKESADGQKALDLAYEDVKAAFDYYLKHYNNGRPIIIASHSQGTCHSRRLLKEYFDGKPLSNQLVVAYAIGYTIRESMYSELKLCNNVAETGCFVSWMSFKMGYEPTGSFSKESESINPLTWTRDTQNVDCTRSLGAIGINFDRKFSRCTSVQLHDNRRGGTILWVKTKVPFVRLLRNMHIVDYNLFWYDIRQNVKDRIKSFEGK